VRGSLDPSHPSSPHYYIVRPLKMKKEEEKEEKEKRDKDGQGEGEETLF
jgi:hypothetical protein